MLQRSVELVVAEDEGEHAYRTEDRHPLPEDRDRPGTGLGAQRKLSQKRNDEKYREEHNSQAVEDTFGYDFEELGNVHRVIYAGVTTPFVTEEGYGFFTGDVVTADDNPELIYAVGIANGEYALLSGDGTLPMAEHHGFKVVGSVFYNLSLCDDYLLDERIAVFVDELRRNGDSGEIRSKIEKTPAFAQQ